MSDSNKSPSSIPAFVLGAAFFYFASLSPEGAPQWFFGILGALSMLTGLNRLNQNLDQDRKIEAANTPSGNFGSARFANKRECAAAGLDDPNGLFLGTHEGEMLFHNGKAHLLTVAPARTGKGISVVTPNLLHWGGSIFVTDPKGELAGMTARHRAELWNQKVCILNPWGLHGLPQHRFNPLAVLVDLYNDEALRRSLTGEVRDLALQLVPEPEGEAKNRFFREGSRKLLRALMLHMATRDCPERCTLPELWRMLQSTAHLEEAITSMALSDALDGVIADLAEDVARLMANNAEQFGDFREGAVQAVDIFEPSGWLADSVSASDFSFAELKSRPTTIYLVIPQDEIGTHGAWLGLLARQAIDAVARQHGNEQVLFLLDEASNMGRIHNLTESLTALPGLGVRVWMIVQELAELRRVYGKEATATIMSQSEVVQFFAVQNHDLAKEISAALGTRTVITHNINLGRTIDENAGESRSETARPLMSPDEIRMLPRDKQILFVQNAPPILAQRVPFWSVRPWGDWAEHNPVEGNTPRSKATFRMRYLINGVKV
ncbi:MAG: type IV secretory system conjugative DNA transfer family protein [Rhodospirillales bacterium]|nr:type IV secretory system conjugative DNA transfer family protein [Rhodospirillales bacterium]